MKKVISVLLIVVLCVSFAACSSGGDDTEVKSPQERIRNVVYNRILVNVLAKYDTQGSPNVTYYLDPISDNTFEVSGRVTVRDKYGDSYSAKYDCVAEYKPDTDDVAITDFELGGFYKQ